MNPAPEASTPSRSRRPPGVRRLDAWLPRSGRFPPRSRRVGTGLCLLGAALVPWLVVLANQLPDRTEVRGWSTAWVGLDFLEAVGLVTTGILVRRQDPKVGPAAAATATILLVDAWFDVTTAADQSARMTAVGMAVFAELPLATLCAVLATRASDR